MNCSRPAKFPEGFKHPYKLLVLLRIPNFFQNSLNIIIYSNGYALDIISGYVCQLNHPGIGRHSNLLKIPHEKFS